MNRLKYMGIIVGVTILAICSTVALFGNVESTGNLSMALNGAGIAQLVAFVALVYLYNQQLVNRNSIWKQQNIREKIGYVIVAVIFAICMIIGKEQTADADLKFEIFAVVMFAGYVPAFYLLVSFCGGWLEKRSADCVLRKPNRLNGAYSHVIDDRWTVGGRLHLLYGLMNARLNSSDMVLDLSQDEWKASGTIKGNMSMPNITLELDENGNVVGYKEGDFFSSLGCSLGASVDLGAIYKPTPGLKISLSVKDLGFIVWNTNSVELEGKSDYLFKGVEIISDTAEDREDKTITKATSCSYTTMMNGKIYAGLEYDFLDNMMSIGVVSKTSYNYNHWDEEITVGYNLRPCRWFGLSASYSLISSKSSAIGLGVNLRLPPFSFYAVSDYTPVHYSAEGIPYKVSALNLQAGVVLTFGCKKKKAVEEEVPVVAEDVLPEPTQTEETEQTQVEEQEQTQVEPAQVEPAQVEEPEPVQVEQTQVEQTQIPEQ